MIKQLSEDIIDTSGQVTITSSTDLAVPGETMEVNVYALYANATELEFYTGDYFIH